MPLEGRGVYARWDADDGSLRVYSSTQTSTSVRMAVAAKLGLPDPPWFEDEAVRDRVAANRGNMPLFTSDES